MTKESAEILSAVRQREFSASTQVGVELNHAGISPSPASVVAAVENAIRGMSRAPIPFFMETLLPTMTQARERLGRLMGVPTEHLAFTRNTGHALSIIADGLTLDVGDNVVVAACDYPAVVYPWYAQSWRGVETRLVDSRPDGSLHIDDFAAQIDSRTRVVALSWVQFGTGVRANLADYAELAHRHGAIVVADVIQAIGAQPCAIAEWNVDVAATGSHKWLMAPPGTGGLYIAPRVLDRMHLVNMGAGSVVDSARFDSRQFHPKPTAHRFEEGSPNVLGLVGLNAALSLIEEVGIERIRDRTLALALLICAGLLRKGYTVTTPTGADGLPESALITFQHPTVPNAEVLAALSAARVTGAVRGDRVRLAPHFYNNEADIDAALAALPA